VSIYPQPISEIASFPEFTGYCHDREEALGKSASFICGSFVRFSLRVDRVTKRVEEIRYNSNGCGFAVATAETLARELHGTGLTDLHGTDQIADRIQSKLGDFPPGRAHCSDMVIDALRAALANYRERVIEEFQGEKALICTCFGVAEETIVNLIEEHRVSDLSEFSEVSNAGSGCGSCQMLIWELIEAPKS
jgi:NifU-like protein involved in Fe-S cluster formation/bacterioferritin-associated ferredoxin